MGLRELGRELRLTMKWKTNFLLTGKTGTGKTTSLIHMLARKKYWPDDTAKMLWASGSGVDINQKGEFASLYETWGDAKNGGIFDIIDCNTALSMAGRREFAPKTIVIFDDSKSFISDPDLGELISNGTNHDDLIVVVVVQDAFEDKLNKIRDECSTMALSDYMLNELKMKDFLRKTTGCNQKECAVVLDLYRNHFHLDLLGEPFKSRDTWRGIFVIQPCNRAKAIWYFDAILDKFFVTDFADDGTGNDFVGQPRR